jgi:hypothetical protein
VRLDLLNGIGSKDYRDPLGQTEEGQIYQRRWIAAMAPVMVRLRGQTQLVDTGLKAIVQEDYHATISPVQQLSSRLLTEAAAALVVVVGVIAILWWIVLRAMRQDQVLGRVGWLGRQLSVHEISTLAALRRNSQADTSRRQ